MNYATLIIANMSSQSDKVKLKISGGVWNEFQQFCKKYKEYIRFKHHNRFTGSKKNAAKFNTDDDCIAYMTKIKNKAKKQVAKQKSFLGMVFKIVFKMVTVIPKLTQNSHYPPVTLHNAFPKISRAPHPLAALW